MTKIIAQVIQRADTKANWLLADPVLTKNERVFEYDGDKRREKIGTGARYSQTPYEAASTGNGENQEPAEAVLEEGVPAALTVGAIDAGKVLPIGMTFTEFVKALVQKVFYPTFVQPSFSLNHAEGANIEVGTTLDVDVVFTFNRGLIKATWPNGIDLPLAGSSITYNYYRGNTFAQTVNSPNFIFSNYTVVPGVNQFKAEVLWYAGEQPKDSQGGNFGQPFAQAFSPEQKTSFNGLYHNFWGAVADVPVTAAQARLPDFNFSNAATISLNTGITQKIFVVIVAPGRRIAQVKDETALGADITAEYQLDNNNYGVHDRSGELVLGYKLYIKTQDGPYDAPHIHTITLANN